MNTLLQTIATTASADLAMMIEEGEPAILMSIHKMEEEAQLQETSPKFNLSFKIALDLEKNSYDCQLSWTLKQSLNTTHEIEDPKQMRLVE